MEHVQFDSLASIHLLWVVALAALVGVYGIWQRQRAMRQFAARRLLPRIAPLSGWGPPLARLVLVCAALAALVIALLGPRWGQGQQQVARRGIDVLVLLDVSRSMLARDIAPNRLERAKLSIRDDLIPALGGDRVGLITFAGVATMKCPLTDDYGFLRLVLDDVSTESAPRGGSLIGDAIRKAAECFDSPIDTHKVVMLITDGEDQESYPVEAARALWDQHKIPIVALALGDERDGARIPVASPRGEKYLEFQGQTVWTKANFDDLRKVAAASDLNAFVPVGTRNFDLGEIYRQRIVPAIKHKERLEQENISAPSRYHPFAVAALALLLIDSLLREGPRRAAGVAAVSARREAA